MEILLSAPCRSSCLSESVRSEYVRVFSGCLCTSILQGTRTCIDWCFLRICGLALEKCKNHTNRAVDSQSCTVQFLMHQHGTLNDRALHPPKIVEIALAFGRHNPTQDSQVLIYLMPVHIIITNIVAVWFCTHYIFNHGVVAFVLFATLYAQH